uniref:hypothetical protein n=1 Tax=Bordetella sputigena TaxID=1416810 RepID=UPI0039EEC432
MVGLVFDAVAMFGSYFTQHTLFNEKSGTAKKDSHKAPFAVAVTFSGLSLIAFAVGAVTAVLSAR